jgi:hypothetical protein
MFSACVLRLALPPQSAAQAQDAAGHTFAIWQPVSLTGQDPAPRPSAGRTIALHGAVGAGAGLIIGLVLSGSDVGDDNTDVILTWTALGAAAGVVSGVVTWLVTRPPT